MHAMTPPTRETFTHGQPERTALGLYIDCCTALTGTKLLGALFDAWLELERLQALLTAVAPDGARITAEQRVNGGISGVYVEIAATTSQIKVLFFYLSIVFSHYGA